MRRPGIGGLVGFSALVCAMAVPAVPAQAVVEGGTLPPWFICYAGSNANRVALETSLSPANGATVQTGTPVMFSGSSEAPVTFAVASSLALLSSPDIDSGPATLLPGTSTYTFTSTKATATPGTVYWDASFSDATVPECAGESPTTFTTQVRTLTVSPLPSPPPTPVTPTTTPETQPAATGGVSLDGATIGVQRTHEAAVKLACAGTGACSGRLILTAMIAKGDRSRTGEKASTAMTTIGSASFSVSAGKTARVRLTLNATGRALLKADHGRLSTNLTILQSSPASSHTHTYTVQLVQQKARSRMKK
jgi:hypothetical protein